ncbi:MULTISPECIES: hypothetical protein [Paenibacillus]|uniref:Uncharacterized protein n=1 Tax=Paenibacillus naphthalenovorans TaxID=162209 RepID=A0A0U2U7M7_9BACL|nr:MULTISPECIES: hypothetical protein [Paenibacillus]ALS22361.1 hypothetical protein IJ22_19870 [Paenibacillus naphthalenovorans]NTZ16829.1 C4-dicarboxylate ABC transporter [Paenibacillus sp. JMULE4]GCL70153.1 hypothetical protein PN4B1_00530 [Paenibacillus naphthalenovorans]SDH90518.1 hypothetical protein SAMN05421868_101513 [Paenibacillus naphthalenovorans]
MVAKEKERDNTDSSALWMGWIGIIAGIIAFFFSPVLFGCAAIILGLITVFSQANNLGWWAIGLGLVGAAANMWLY